MNVEIIEDWYDDLIWCPSQCYLHVAYGDRFFIIYLRWRHDNPWSADLIECESDFKFFGPKYEEWELDIGFYRDVDLEQLKDEAFELSEEMILNL